MESIGPSEKVHETALRGLPYHLMETQKAGLRGLRCRNSPVVAPSAAL